MEQQAGRDTGSILFVVTGQLRNGATWNGRKAGSLAALACCHHAVGHEACRSVPSLLAVSVKRWAVAFGVAGVSQWARRGALTARGEANY